MPEKGRFASATDEQLKDVKWLRAHFKELQQAQERLDIAEKTILELQTSVKELSESSSESLSCSRTIQPSSNEKSETFATELHSEVKMSSAAEHFQGQPTENAREKSERQKVSDVKQCLQNSLRREDEKVAKMTARDERTGSSSGFKMPTNISRSKEPDAKLIAF
ncbi:uncharacterized protein Bfra_011177 [Botrytis fragariae]|uniref:Uncharacterized protein n=1 Tax=Botrytis fragariae TaxID=1964551 RepID=A0A8H6EEN0_9HELO|nr:uncharacterized protein Bfra_011177 [Botrytis fragariae]KAF5869371.1 hypothetical protein Bfra_011177 [Botrytis fragariae]